MLKSFVWLHRWLGIVLCLFFAVWFASGAVLLFVPFPSLSQSEANDRAERVPLEAVRISPAAALATTPGATDLKLIGVQGEPVYVLSAARGDRAVSASSGRPSQALAASAAGRIASAFGGAPVTSVSRPIVYDQWVVHQAFDHARPFYRVALADGRGTEVYVSARTGEVIQKTQGYERAWNWVGAVAHWLYFVPIRKTFAVWDQTVWWISLVGIFMTMTGVGLGVYRTTKKMQNKRPGISPFKGWLRWHHILGICASLFVFTWILSGWLSMDHGRLFSRGASPAMQTAAYAGESLPAAVTQLSVDSLRSLGPAKAVHFNVLGGRLVTSAAQGQGRSRVILAGIGTSERLPSDLIAAGLRRSWPGAVITGPDAVTPSDFYAKAEGLAPGMDVYRLSGRARAQAYVDPSSGRIVAFVNGSRAVYDWVYYGLHTFNIPGLLSLPILRDALVLPLLALGFALCVTSVIVGVRRLRIVAAS